MSTLWDNLHVSGIINYMLLSIISYPLFFFICQLSNKLYIYQRETIITSSSETYTYDGYDHFNRNIEINFNNIYIN